MKEVEFVDRDFLDNKIEIGDKVIFEAPKYRDFAIGTVISKAAKSCQIEYINDWNYPGQGRKDVVRQCYGQLIKYPITKEGKWEKLTYMTTDDYVIKCSNCGESFERKSYQSFYNYCPHCGSKMLEE